MRETTDRPEWMMVGPSGGLPGFMTVAAAVDALQKIGITHWDGTSASALGMTAALIPQQVLRVREGMLQIQERMRDLGTTTRGEVGRLIQTLPLEQLPNSVRLFINYARIVPGDVPETAREAQARAEREGAAAIRHMVLDTNEDTGVEEMGFALQATGNAPWGYATEAMTRDGDHYTDFAVDPSGRVGGVDRILRNALQIGHLPAERLLVVSPLTMREFQLQLRRLLGKTWTAIQEAGFAGNVFCIAPETAFTKEQLFAADPELLAERYTMGERIGEAFSRDFGKFPLFGERIGVATIQQVIRPSAMDA